MERLMPLGDEAEVMQAGVGWANSVHTCGCCFAGYMSRSKWAACTAEYTTLKWKSRRVRMQCISLGGGVGPTLTSRAQVRPTAGLDPKSVGEGCVYNTAGGHPAYGRLCLHRRPQPPSSQPCLSCGFCFACCQPALRIGQSCVGLPPRWRTSRAACPSRQQHNDEYGSCHGSLAEAVGQQPLNPFLC